MARTVRVYRSSDASAPVLSGTANAMVALLDAVLVAGYGSATAAGWTKPYTGTNIAVFRNDTTDGTGSYYRCQDDLTSTSARFFYLTMAETMSAVSTATNPYPSGGITSTLLGGEKSATADATARDWVIVADNCAAHIFVKHGSNGTDWEWYFIGDIFSYKASDAYKGCIAARGNNSSAITGLTYTSNTNLNNRQISASSAAMGLVRKHDGVGTSLHAGMHTDTAKMNTSFSSAQGYFGSSTCNVLAYPNAVNSGVFLAPIWVHQNTTAPYIVRGYMPGLWAPLHNRPLSNNDTFSGASTALSGKTFEAFNVYSSGQIFIETSNTWS